MPSPGDLPDLGMEPSSLKSPALRDGSLPLEPHGKPTLGLITTQSVGKDDAIERETGCMNISVTRTQLVGSPAYLYPILQMLNYPIPKAFLLLFPVSFKLVY